MSVRKEPSDTSRVIKNPLFAVSSLGLMEDYKERSILLPAAAPIEDEPELKGKFQLCYFDFVCGCMHVMLYSTTMLNEDRFGLIAMTLHRNINDELQQVDTTITTCLRARFMPGE